MSVGVRFMAPRGGGVIINTASMAGIYPHPIDPVYAAAKGGVVHLTFSLNRWAKSAACRSIAYARGSCGRPVAGEDRPGDKRRGRQSGAAHQWLQPERIAEVVLNFVRDDNCVGQIVEVRPSGPNVVEPPRAPKRRH